jgi:hypothetical protein
MVRYSVLALLAVVAAAVLAACGGGGSSDPTATPAPPGSAGGPAAVAAIADTCGLLTDSNLTPLGKAAAGRPLQPATGGGITSAICRWDINENSALELTVYVFAADYNGAKDFAKPALESAASDAGATVQPVSGVGEYAGVAVPDSHGTTSSANLLAQNGAVAFKLKFTGQSGATWPTAAQLEALGKAVAAKLFAGA